MHSSVLVLIVAIATQMATTASQGIRKCGECDTTEKSGYPRDCTEAYKPCDLPAESEVIWIQPDDAPEPFKVHCNNSVDGGRWTVIQRRMDGSVDFYNNWDTYKKGFGFLGREFWLGNDKISYLTNQGDYELRIDFVNSLGDTYFAKYDLFRISNELSLYRMVDLGNYLPESTSGYDALNYHRNMSFTTYDRDYDRSSNSNCASTRHGAWWYNSCQHSNLNGHYFADDDTYSSVRWKSLPGNQYNIHYTEMKVRRL